MMGEADLEEVDAKRLRSFLKFDPETKKNDESWKSFEAAVDSGTSTLKENKKKFEGDDPDYQIIDLAAARSMGILPISSSAPAN